MAYTCGLSKTSTYGSSALENYGWRITNLFSTFTACDLWLLLVILRFVWIRKGDVISWITVNCRLYLLIDANRAGYLVSLIMNIGLS